MFREYSPYEGRDSSGRGPSNECEVIGARCPRCGAHLEYGKNSPGRSIYFCSTCGYYYEGY